MPRSRESYQAAGQIGGIKAAALRPEPWAAANKARLQKYLDKIPAEITDPAERLERALKLRYADMLSLAMKGNAARKRAAAARREATEADAALAELSDGAA